VHVIGAAQAVAGSLVMYDRLSKRGGGSVT
jgi:hypothetical protein